MSKPDITDVMDFDDFSPEVQERVTVPRGSQGIIHQGDREIPVFYKNPEWFEQALKVRQELRSAKERSDAARINAMQREQPTEPPIGSGRSKPKATSRGRQALIINRFRGAGGLRIPQ